MRTARKVLYEGMGRGGVGVGEGLLLRRCWKGG